MYQIEFFDRGNQRWCASSANDYLKENRETRIAAWRNRLDEMREVCSRSAKPMRYRLIKIIDEKE